MDTNQAIKVCQQWFAHLERQREKALKMQELAAMARQGPEQQKEAKRQLQQIDKQPKVFDGAYLEPAVRTLVEALTPTQNTRHGQE